MNAFYVLSLFAPFVVFFMYLYRLIDGESCICAICAFVTCFITSMFSEAFYGVITGVVIYTVLYMTLNTVSHKRRKSNQKFAIVSGKFQDCFQVVSNGEKCNAICLEDNIKIGDVVVVEWEKKGVLFVSKHNKKLRN